ncbi:MAG: hypothetical protein P8106_06580 [Gammaproteobacteria bacterium]
MHRDNPPTDAARAEGLSLGLRIPDQADAPEDSFLLDPKATREWLESLPVANIGETARLTFGALVDANRMEIPDVVRARVLELFREPVRYLCRNLEKHFLELGFPLADKSHKAALLARELNAEMAIGYKVIVERILRGAGKRLDEKLLALALHRALAYLGEVLYRSALIYRPWPAGTWREIHSLYAYAEQNRLLLVNIKDALSPSGNDATIERAYRRILLFAATKPDRLRQADVCRAYTAAREWSPHARVYPLGEETGTSGRYAVDLGGDAPPTHLALAHPSASRRLRILDLRHLVADLRADFDRQEKRREGEPGLPPKLLRDLIERWHEPPKRRFVRTHLNFELHVLTGIKAIHQALSGATVPPPVAGGPAPMAPRPPDAAQSGGSPRIPVWAQGASGGVGLAPLDSRLTDEPTPRPGGPMTEEENAAQARWRAPARPAPASRVSAAQPVQTFNESAGGYCIRWPQEHPTKVKVGEILGIRAGDDGRHYAVGVVRWMRQDPQHDLELGVQILAGHCQPGDLGPTRGGQKAGKPRDACLLLPKSGPEEHDTSLITAASTLEVGTELWLTSRGQERRIKLTRLMECCGAFGRYEFRLVNPLPEEKRNADAESGFDDLWGQL